MVKIHPITRQRYTFAKHSGDIVLDAQPPSQSDALTNEDVRVIGPYSDYSTIQEPSDYVANYLFTNPDNLGEDASGNGFNGTNSGVTQSSGPPGFQKAGDFNGSSSINIGPSSTLLKSNIAWTIVSWFKARTISSSSGGNRIIALRRGGGGGTTGASLMTGSTNKFQIAYRGSSGSITLTVADISTDVWYHGAISYDGTTIRSYFNGKLVGSNVDTFGGFSTLDAFIGSFGGADQFFDGDIAQTKVFNRTLTDDEVRFFFDGKGEVEIDSRTQQMWSGHENQLFGTVAQVESGEDLDNLSVVGTSASINRRRRKKLYIDLDK